MTDLFIRNVSLYHEGWFRTADVRVENGIVTEAGQGLSAGSLPVLTPSSTDILCCGLADVHVHLREPGFTSKETIRTGTAAALAGGYTTVCAMPNINPVPDSLSCVERELEIIRKDALVEVRPYAAITVGRAGRELVDFETLSPLVCGFSDDGSGVQDAGIMREAMERVRECDSILAAHCEDNSLLNGGYIHEGAYNRAHGHAGICSASEWKQIERDVRLAADTGCRYHVCHVSTAESVEIIRDARKSGVDVTCETAPHYLALTEEDLQEDGRFKMNPPLRGRRDRDALIEGLLDGTISIIATDHAPHTREEKSRGLKGSAMGIVGLETAWGVLNTFLVKPGIVPVEKILDALTVNPRRRFRLGGEFKVGQPANLTLLDTETKWKVDPELFKTMGRATPFEGLTLVGKPRQVIR